MKHEFGFIDSGHHYIYRFSIDHLDKLAVILSLHANRDDHPMAWTLAVCVIEDARRVRAAYGTSIR